MLTKDALHEKIHVMEKVQPRLRELTQHYQMKKSHFDKFAVWYCEHPWWEKFITGGLVLSVSYTVGSLLGMGLFLSVIITGLYMMATSIMEEHVDTMKQNERLFLDLQESKLLMEESFKSFCLLEEKFNAVFESLSSLHTQRSENISEFEAKLEYYVKIIESLDELSKNLLAQQDAMAVDEAEIKKMYADLKDGLDGVSTLHTTLAELVVKLEEELNTQKENNKEAPKAEAQPNPKAENEAVRAGKEAQDDFDDFDREFALFREQDAVPSRPRAPQASVGLLQLLKLTSSF